MNTCNRNTVSKTCVAAAVASAILMFAGVPTIADETLVPVAAITLPNKITSFDISYVNSQLGIYVLGDRTGKTIDVVDTTSNTLLFQAGLGSFVGFTGNNNTSGPDGAIIVEDKEIWAGDGDSTMKVLSLFDGSLRFTISTGGTGRVDEMCYDPVDGILMAANNADNPPFSTFFSTRTKQILGKMKFDGSNGTFNSSNGAEQCQWSPRTGKFYITIPEVNGAGDNSSPGGVVQIDPVAMTVTNKVLLPLANCTGPQGMAIGPGSQILIGCNGGPNTDKTSPSVVIDDGSGAAFGTILATIPNQAGPDMVDYNAASSHYTLAKSNNGLGTPPFNQTLGIIDASNFTSDADVITGIVSGADGHSHGNNHSIASDSVTNKYFMPIASSSGLTLCSSVGGTDSQGCILVLQRSTTDTADDPSIQTCPAQGTPVINVAGFSPSVLTFVCQ